MTPYRCRSLLLASALILNGFGACPGAFALPFVKAASESAEQLEAPDAIPKVKLSKEQQAQYNAALKNAQLYMAQSQTDMAKVCFKSMIELDGNSIEGHMGMAQCLANSADIGPAEIELFEVLRNKPFHVEARILLGQLMMKDSRWDEAGGQFLQVLKTDAKNVVARGNLALCLQQLGQVDAAILQYKMILQDHPKEAMAAFNLGAAYESKKWIDEAIFYYKRASEIDPSFYNAYCAIAKCLVAKKQYTDALTLLNHAGQINKNNYYTFLIRGFVYEQMGRKTDAIKCYTTAVGLNPKDWNSKKSLERMLEQGHDKELAHLKRLQTPSKM